MSDTSTLAVHRCRFVDYTPSAVTALAFPPLPLPSVKSKGKKPASSSLKAPRFGTLVVGRANGNIEICEWTGTEHHLEAPQAWTVRKTLSGPYSSKIDSLALALRDPSSLGPEDVPSVSDLRLFSAGGSSDLVEWDMEKGRIKRIISSQGGSIWCIAPNPSSTQLALGCEDGSIRLLSIADGALEHHRRSDRVKSRLLSIAWGPPVPKQKPLSQKPSSSDESSDEDDDEDEWTDVWLVTGCSDSSLRKWDVATGRAVERMGTDKTRGERTLVWSVGVLGDGTIVSGDSLGMVKFWDSRTCTQLQSFQGHGADVLCLTVGPEGTAVYTSGVDQKITQFSLVKTEAASSRTANKWVQSSSRRMHSHDVRSLAIWPPYTPLPPSYKRQFPLDVSPILASGGLDMSVVLTPAALPTSTVTKVINPLSTSTVSTFEDSYHRRLAYTSGPANATGMCLARRAGLVLAMREAGLSVWRVQSKRSKEEIGVDDDDGGEGEEGEGGGWESILEMDLNVQTNLIASAISDDGRWLVASDLYETKLFSLDQDSNGELRPRRVRDFSTTVQASLSNSSKSPASTGCSSFAFTPDSSKLVMATCAPSYILIVDLGKDDEGKPRPRILRRFEQHRMRDVALSSRALKRKAANGTQEDVEGDVEMADADSQAPSDDEESEEAFVPGVDAPVNALVTRMAVSPDGQWLATTDDRCRTHIFNLDSIQHHSVLPGFPQPIHALSFSPVQPSVLVLALANNTIHIYDVESRQFPDWSRPLCSSLPKRFTHLHDPVLGVCFDPSAREGKAGQGLGKHALFWGATWLCKVKLDEPSGWGGFSKKRRRKSAGLAAGAKVTTVGEEGQHSQQQQNFKLITHYRPILFVDFLAPAELLVVERPLVDVLAKLPPAYFKPKYGAS